MIPSFYCLINWGLCVCVGGGEDTSGVIVKAWLDGDLPALPKIGTFLHLYIAESRIRGGGGGGDSLDVLVCA